MVVPFAPTRISADTVVGRGNVLKLPAREVSHMG